MWCVIQRLFLFFKQKTAYEMRISDWSSDVCSSDLTARGILDHKLTVAAQRYTPVNDALIPTGELKPVAGGVFDFTSGRILGDGIRDGRDPQIVAGRGYDHTFVLDKGVTGQHEFAARPADPDSGRVSELWTTEPGATDTNGTFPHTTTRSKAR